MNPMPKKIATLCVLLSALLFFHACDNSTPTNPGNENNQERGYLYNAEFIVSYTPQQIEQITNLMQIEHNYTFLFDVRVYRIIYQSIDWDDKLIRLSGLVMVPVTVDSIPILTINHGTKTGRDEVASTWPTLTPEGVAGIWMASMGYYCVLPDYAGFGISEIMHPYFHAKSLTTSIIDALRAAKKYAQNENHTLSGQLFLTGYSEGGYAALATHKEIEAFYSTEFRVSASAPMAGPYDLSQLITYIFKQQTFPSGAYIAFLLNAYNTVYRWDRLDDIFNLPYSQMIPELFDGSMTFSEIDNQLPNEIGLLLKESFTNDYIAGKETEIEEAMAENTLLNWKPNAPIRFFHGDADKIVPYFNVTSTVSSLKASANVEIDLVTIEGANHETAGEPCIFSMIDWINSQRSK